MTERTDGWLLDAVLVRVLDRLLDTVYDEIALELMRELSPEDEQMNVLKSRLTEHLRQQLLTFLKATE